MKILAIETSCEHATVALSLSNEIVQYSLEGHNNHSERLLPLLRQLLAEAQLGLTALDALAFGAGPGAFTGLRLACGVVQGLAMGADLGVVPVNSLGALALQAPASLVFVATDARMGEAYSASYRLRGDLPEALQEPVCVSPQYLRLPTPGDWFAIGSALQAYEVALEEQPDRRLIGIDAQAYPQAREVARIAAHETACGRIIAPELAVPLYVRNKVALTAAEQKARKERA